jgi:hypothetical protein
MIYFERHVFASHVSSVVSWHSVIVLHAKRGVICMHTLSITYVVAVW